MYNKKMIWWARILVIGLMLVMVTIPARFIVRNVFFERLGICEPWMEFFLQGDAELRDMLVQKEDGENVGEVSMPTDWEKLYPFPDASEELETNEVGVWDKGMAVIESLEEKITAYCETELVFYASAIDFASRLEVLAGIQSTDIGDILQMQNGYLTYEQEKVSDEDIEVIAEEVQDFASFLSELDIPFFYANAGSKVCPYDRQLEDSTKEYTNENGTALMTALEQRGVDTLDFRELMQEDGLDWYDSYYKTDHHWKTETGLWAAGKLAEKLNETGRLDFDLTVFDKENYQFDTFDDFFLGGQGRTVTLAYAQLESYTRILPKFETNFSLQIPTRALELTGSYDEALFDEERFGRIRSYSASDYLSQMSAYECIRARNDALVHIQNQQPEDNQDKKILLLQDSFSFYSTSFLACDIGAVDTIHLSAFTGSVRTYIEQTKPDAVALMYWEGNIEPIDWTTHTSNFDLR
jgi:hypothetical protein